MHRYGIYSNDPWDATNTAMLCYTRVLGQLILGMLCYPMIPVGCGHVPIYTIFIHGPHWSCLSVSACFEHVRVGHFFGIADH